jgi:hypothetical protein
MKPRDYPCLASAAPLDIATAEVKFRLLLRAQNRFDNKRWGMPTGSIFSYEHGHNCLICKSWSVNWRREHGGHERVSEPCFCSCGALLYAHRPEHPDTIDAPFEP